MSQRSPVIPDPSPIPVPVGGLYRTEGQPNPFITYSAVRDRGVFVLRVCVCILPGDGDYELATMAYFANSTGGVSVAVHLNSAPQAQIYSTEEAALKSMVSSAVTTVRVERERITSELRAAAPNNTYAELVSAVEKFSRAMADEELYGFHLSAVRFKLKQACLMALKTSYEIAVRGGASMDEVSSVFSEGLAKHVIGS